MNLLMERSKEKGLPTVHAFNTFFFTKLKTAGYQAVKRWTKKADIFSVDLLLVPIHLGVHWCLAVSAFVIPDRPINSPVIESKTSWLLREAVVRCLCVGREMYVGG